MDKDLANARDFTQPPPHICPYCEEISNCSPDSVWQSEQYQTHDGPGAMSNISFEEISHCYGHTTCCGKNLSFIKVSPGLWNLIYGEGGFRKMQLVEWLNY